MFLIFVLIILFIHLTNNNTNNPLITTVDRDMKEMEKTYSGLRCPEGNGIEQRPGGWLHLGGGGGGACHE